MHPKNHPTYSQNVHYQQTQSNQTSRPFQQQQFGPRFQTPPQNFTTTNSFCQSREHPRPPYQSPVNPQPFYQPDITNFDKISKPSYPPLIQNFKTSPKPPYQHPVQNFGTLPNPQYPPSRGIPGPDFSPPSIPQYRTPGLPIQNYNQPHIQNYNHPPNQTYNQPPIQTYNQPPIQTYNQLPVQNYNQRPVQNFNHNPSIPSYNQPILNYNQPATPPYPLVNQNSHQPMTPPSNSHPFQSSSLGYGPSPNTPYQPQSPKSSNQLYQLPTDQCYQQRPPTFHLPRQEFNQRPLFRPQGQQIFPFQNQMPRHQHPQHGNNRFQFHSKQPQSYYPRGPPPSLNNQPKDNNFPKKDKLQIACELGDCDFVGHPGAVKEHQHLHHRLGLHKKVLYSNNSDAVKNWIEERKKKWPTKDTIKKKIEIMDEKYKRGERIADDDFQRFNNKNNKFNHSGPKRFDNKKRGKPNNADFIEPIEEPMNGKLKRFAGIVDVLKEKEDKSIEITKPGALKLLEEYAASSDDEPPEEIAIVKESVLFDNQKLIKPEEKIEISEIENKNIDSTFVKNDIKAANIEVKVENGTKVNGECKKSDSVHGQKRKKNSKKESIPIKKMALMKTPRNEVLKRKGALLEALMGDLMRNERNTITQCICYIRNNMERFGKIQAA